MDPHTKELIYLGIHPEQLRLEPYYFLKYKVAKTVKAYWEANKVLAKRQSLPPPPLRRVGHLPPRSGYNRDLEVANILDYHSFAYDRHDFFPCGNSTCQQHMRCGMGAMPKRRNKAWQILSLDGFKSSTQG
ncbi:uncharacterized protein PV06_00312 [Exophiala oligosperma]|uniref:Uncharacterized protein n=2 Tax=Chaetothyriales TaxID=34395 RepID=A0A0D2DX10_9EURO|nr:uncharacterized protein PV06_00312 [Exophiala oligosperma]KAJ9647601.1 hypothetical protein H2204_000231 [Knufia peltigerae]KIW47633.1 hypothetical protein PV06_00312 [Exophiala oligosperma]